MQHLEVVIDTEFLLECLYGRVLRMAQNASVSSFKQPAYNITLICSLSVIYSCIIACFFRCWGAVTLCYGS